MIKHNNTSLGKGYISLRIYKDSLLNKYDILRENKWKSGIYRWVNSITNESYIGSSVDLYSRFRDYYSDKYLNRRLLIGNSRIYRALLDYGYETFNLEILEYCPKEFIIRREQHYINLLKPEYNIQSIARMVLLPPGYVTTVVNKKDNSTKVYDSMSAAARDIKVNYSTFRYYINKDKLLKDIYLVSRPLTK